MSDTQPKKEFKSALLRGSKLQLSAPCPTAKGKYSKAYWDVYQGNPRFVVRTNDPEDEGNEYGRITAAMELPTFYTLLELIEAAANHDGAVKYKIDCMNHPRGQGNDRSEIALTHEIHVGKDSQGRVYISAIDKLKQRPVIQFFFTMPDNRFHVVYENGTEITEAQKTCRYARSYVQLLRGLIPSIIVADHEPFTPKGGGGGNWKGKSGGGNWQNNRQGGGWKGNNQNYQGGGQRRQSNESSSETTQSDGFDVDDSIPF